jgi:hypothetical protein
MNLVFAALELALALARPLGLVLALFAGLAIGQARAGGDLGYPEGAFAVTAASGTVANASAAATIAAAAGRRNFLCGFTITSTGSTAAAVVAPTVTGLVTGTLTYAYATVAGATLSNQPVTVKFSPCVPASADGTAIVVTLPALGAGNTNAAVTAWGYRN